MKLHRVTWRDLGRATHNLAFGLLIGLGFAFAFWIVVIVTTTTLLFPPRL